MAKRYAAVEFERKECAVVPMGWIINRDCYLPKTTHKLKFLIETASPPDLTWSLFKIEKILCVCGKLYTLKDCSNAYLTGVCAYRVLNRGRKQTQ